MEIGLLPEPTREGTSGDEIVGVLISFHFTLDHVDLLSVLLDLSGLVSASTWSVLSIFKGRLHFKYFGFIIGTARRHKIIPIMEILVLPRTKLHLPNDLKPHKVRQA